MIECPSAMITLWLKKRAICTLNCDSVGAIDKIKGELPEGIRHDSGRWVGTAELIGKSHTRARPRAIWNDALLRYSCLTCHQDSVSSN